MPVKYINKNELLNAFEVLASRVELLGREEKLLIRLFQAGRSYQAIAITAQVSPGTVTRRLKKIARRISDDRFIAGLSNENASIEQMKILKEKFINGKSISQIARHTGLSPYKIRRIINTV
ncbi:MAG: hypothetical protein PHP01_05770 [Phycisphaerae bacterium]|nr:hypothetical protein [Phycisphaerae bacterium]